MEAYEMKNEFLENITKTVNKTTKKALKASGEIIDLTKAAINIKMEEAKKESFYLEIGRLMFDKFKDDSDSVPEEIVDFCKCIDEIDSNINALKIFTAKIKNQKFCASCNVKLDLNDPFCYKCGEKQPEIVIEEEEDCDCEPECCCDESAESEEDCGCGCGDED